MTDSWPDLPFDAWRPTCDTLHMWTQIVGKVRLALAPYLNHWWQVPLYVSPRGRAQVARFWRVLQSVDAVFKEFRGGFIGKASPVHFFWGSFDLAVTRFSGRRAPPMPDADVMTREGYSHEVSSVGWWPGDETARYPAFYAYAAPEPAGFGDAKVRPDAAHYDREAGQFRLKYDDVRSAASPRQAILDFCQSTYAAAATLADWNRAELER